MKWGFVLGLLLCMQLPTTVVSASEFSFVCKSKDKTNCIPENEHLTTDNRSINDLCGINAKSTHCSEEGDHFRCKVKGSACVESGSPTNEAHTTYECDGYEDAEVLKFKSKDWSYGRGKYLDVDRTFACLVGGKSAQKPTDSAKSGKSKSLK